MPTLLASFYFFYFSIIGIYVIFLPKVLSMVHYTPSEIGIILAAAPLVRFIVPLFFMRYLTIDQRMFNTALLIMVFSAISFYFTIESFYSVLISNIFFGVGLSLVLPYLELIALYYLAKERYGKIRLFGSLGFIAVALLLVDHLDGAKTALLFLLILAIVTATIAFIISKNATLLHKEPKKIKNDIDLLRDWRLWGGFILMQVGFGSFYNFFTISVTDSGVALDTTIYLWSFGVVVEIAMLYTQAPLLKLNLLRVIQATTLITSLRWLLIYIAPSSVVLLFASQSLHAFSFALFHSASISYLFYLYAHRSLAQQLFSGLAYGLGAFVGALSSGFIYDHFPQHLFLVSSIITLVATYLFLTFKPSTSKTQKV